MRAKRAKAIKRYCIARWFQLTGKEDEEPSIDKKLKDAYGTLHRFYDKTKKMWTRRNAA